MFLANFLHTHLNLSFKLNEFSTRKSCKTEIYVKFITTYQSGRNIFVLTQILTRCSNFDAAYSIFLVFSAVYYMIQRTCYECV